MNINVKPRYRRRRHSGWMAFYNGVYIGLLISTLVVSHVAIHKLYTDGYMHKFWAVVIPTIKSLFN